MFQLCGQQAEVYNQMFEIVALGGRCSDPSDTLSRNPSCVIVESKLSLSQISADHVTHHTSFSNVVKCSVDVTSHSCCTQELCELSCCIQNVLSIRDRHRRLTSAYNVLPSATIALGSEETKGDMEQRKKP